MPGQRGDLVSAAELGLARARQRRRLVDPKECSGLPGAGPSRSRAKTATDGSCSPRSARTGSASSTRTALSRSTTSRRPRATPGASRAPTSSGSPSTTETGSGDFRRARRAPWWSSRFRRSRPALSGSRRGRAVRRCGSPRTWPTRSDASTQTARSRSLTSRRRTAARPAIVRGFDGSQELMYFTEARGNKIASIAITGQVTERPIPTPNSSPTDLIFDDFEQAIWFTERNAGKLGWMSTDGDFKRVPASGVREAREPRDRLRPVPFRTDVDLVSGRDEPACRTAFGQPPLRDRRPPRRIARHPLRALQSRRRGGEGEARLGVQRRLPGNLSCDEHQSHRAEARRGGSNGERGSERRGAAFLLRHRDRARDQRRARHAGVDRG